MTNKKYNLNRRQFLKGGVALGVFTGVGALVPFSKGRNSIFAKANTGDDYEQYTAENVIYSQCEQCNTNCTIKTVVVPADDSSPSTSYIRKISGNPYSPLNNEPHGQIDYQTNIREAVKGKGHMSVDGRAFNGGRTCLKGQAGIQTAFDAKRLRQPLKRVGSRGSGEWKTISWEQAIEEIINGAEDIGTPGLKDIWAYVPEKAVMEDWEKVQSGELTKTEFDAKYKDALIDTDHPDFGPKANQIVSLAGDRRDFIHDRFWNQSLGSINAHDHAGICGISGVFGNVRSFAAKSAKKRMYGDVDNAEFTIIWGTDPFIANKGPTWLAPKFINAKQRGMKLAVIDPKFSNAAEKADMWIAPKPGTDIAIAYGMARWIIENERFDRQYLVNPNKEQATADGEPTWSDATLLVNLDHPNRPKLRAKDIGIVDETLAGDFVVIEQGNPVANSQATEGQLEVDTTINGIRVKSVFTLYKERVFERSIDEYAEISQIDANRIVQLADEFTSHGKKASIISYRGPAMRSNGFNNIRALNTLNHLIGNYDWKGGSISAGARYKPFSGRYELAEMPNALKPWGIKTDRSQRAYESTSLFKRDGYPAKRPWFPLANKIIHEVIPSAVEQYPYPIKAMFVQRVSPILSFPAGHTLAELLKDQQAIPLLVVNDIVMSETALLADYVLPDVTYLERFGTDSIYPNQPLNVSMFRQPVTRVYPEPRPTEDVYIELGKRLGLPGCGDNAFPDGSSLHHIDDYYIKMVANIAYDKEPVDDANEEEMDIFYKSRSMALGDRFRIDDWKKAVKEEEWAKVVYVLNRGGRFGQKGSGYEGEHIKHQSDAQAVFYDENTAKNKHAYTGKHFDGVPTIEDVTYYNGDVVQETNLPLQFINWKAPYIGTHRNVNNPWLREIEPQHTVWINPVDANKRGIADGDRVIVHALHHEVETIAHVTERIKPGVVGTEYNSGHYAYGDQTVIIDGKQTETYRDYGHAKWIREGNVTGYAKKRSRGFSVNDMQRLDASYLHGTICDWIGGGASQLDINVEISKA